MPESYSAVRKSSSLVAPLALLAKSCPDKSAHLEYEPMPDVPGPLSRPAPYTHSQSQRDCVLQPRVARNELPWEIVPRRTNPARAAARLCLISFATLILSLASTAA